MAEFESDQVLVERAKSGDVKAFDFLVIKYQRRVIRLLSRIVRDSSEVEDIAQESFLKAYKAISKFRGDSAFYTWLYRIAVNTAKNYLFAKGRRPIAMSDLSTKNDDGESHKEYLLPSGVLLHVFCGEPCLDQALTFQPKMKQL